MHLTPNQPVQTLGESGQFLLRAMSGWRYAIERGTCPPVALGCVFAHINVHSELPDLHLAVSLLHCSGREGSTLAPIDLVTIVEDEAMLLSVGRGSAAGSPKPPRSEFALVAGGEVAPPVLRAIGSATVHLQNGGFDMSRLTPVH